MKQTDKMNKIADECARKHGRFFAYYLGQVDDMFVYSARYADNSPYKEMPPDWITIPGCFPLAYGLRDETTPQLIVVRNNEANYISDDSALSLLHSIKSRHYPSKGKAILKDYRFMYENHLCKSEEDKLFISEIIASLFSGYDVPVDENELCEFLETADRLNMSIAFFPSPDNMNQDDGWVYFIKLVEGSMPERISSNTDK